MSNQTKPVRIGSLIIGGNSPVVFQSMTTTDPVDLEGSLAQIKALHKAGCPLIRLSITSIDSATALGHLCKTMQKEGLTVPLVADVHFQPKAALEAANHVAKVRINPGNFASSTSEGHKRLSPLLARLRARGAALRIGVNHGSLAPHIADKFGNGALGLVESALEYLHFCREKEFDQVVVSIKASNPVLMVEANRLLKQKMSENSFAFPIHLGVTEAGEGEAGILRSAAGIAALLIDGIGDTIRVSLTGDPVRELPPCIWILRTVEDVVTKANASPIGPLVCHHNHAAQSDQSGQPEHTGQADQPGQPLEADWCGLLVGGNNPPRVELARALENLTASPLPTTAESVLIRAPEKINSKAVDTLQQKTAALHAAPAERKSRPPLWLELPPSAIIARSTPLLPIIKQVDGLSLPVPNLDQLSQADEITRWLDLILSVNPGLLIRWRLTEIDQSNLSNVIVQLYDLLLKYERVPSCFDLDNPSLVQTARLLLNNLPSSRETSTKRPLLALRLPANPLLAASDAGTLLLDQQADLLVVDESLPDCEQGFPADELSLPARTNIQTAYSLLQATRRRTTATEFISCPGCGRLQYDLARTVHHVKQKFGHLQGIKFAVMGCIVNGPGEMVDADYGYVGSGKNKVDLYENGHCRRKGLSLEEADLLLVDLLCKRNLWQPKQPGSE